MVNNKQFPGKKLRESSTLLKTYSGERLRAVGETDVKVEYERQKASLTLTVVAGDGPSLLWRNRLQFMKLNWCSIKAVNTPNDGSLNYLLDKFNDVFMGKLGTIKSFCAKLSLKAGEEPKFFKPRSVPCAVRGAIDEELDRLEQQGILEKVTHSEWASFRSRVEFQADNAQLVRSTGANVSVMALQGCKTSPQKSRPLKSGHRRHGVWVAIEYSYVLGQKMNLNFGSGY